MEDIRLAGLAVALVPLALGAQQLDVAKWDPNMILTKAVVTNGCKWIDGKDLPIEGRAFDDVEHYYDRLPANVTSNVNPGVRHMKHYTAGMQFRFVTDSKNLHFRWTPYNEKTYMDHMPASGHSGIDIYRYDAALEKWVYVRTGRVRRDQAKLAAASSLDMGWTPGTPCLVNLPLYNGVQTFSLGLDPTATLAAAPARKSGITKPVVFYGTSITQGGCASRPGMAFPSIVGRELDVPIVNLGFSGSGRMELEMAEYLARIDASCYVLDCLWNMGGLKSFPDPSDDDLRAAGLTKKSSSVESLRTIIKVRYEPFVRALRAKRPDVPIVFAEQCDVFCKGPSYEDRLVRAFYDKLVAEGWKNLVYLPKTKMYTWDLEGCVDGCHPNDRGMMSMAKAFGEAIREALAGAGGSAAELGFVSLFNGKDLTGWHGATDTYGVLPSEPGVLQCLPKQRDGKEGNGGHLCTKKEYRNFILRFEFCMPKNGNNGLGVRMQDAVRESAYYGMCEVQLVDDDKPILKPEQFTGAIYGIQGPRTDNVGKLPPDEQKKYSGRGSYSYVPGLWNAEEVRVAGEEIEVYLNGWLVNKADLSKWRGDGDTVDGKPHPGLRNRRGFIGWLGHGHNVKWRNIRVRELPDVATLKDLK